MFMVSLMDLREAAELINEMVGTLIKNEFLSGVDDVILVTLCGTGMLLLDAMLVVNNAVVIGQWRQFVIMGLCRMTLVDFGT